MTFFRLTTILAALIFFPFALSAQKEAAFKKQCAILVSAFAKQDFRTLNKYINNATGIYIITRPGAIDALNKFDSLSNQSFSFYPYKDAKVAKNLAPKFGVAPKYNCGDEKWNKAGFYADSTHYNRLSELMHFLTQNEMGGFGLKEQTKAKELESKSRKIVYTELAKKHGVVFYLTYINKKWCLTLVDAVASDCGA